jgi:hypothetical protein
MSGPLTGWGWAAATLKKAPQKDHTFRISLDKPVTHTGLIAYELVREVYRWFGFEDDRIPYVALNEAGVPILSPDEMTKPMT